MSSDVKDVLQFESLLAYYEQNLESLENQCKELALIESQTINYCHQLIKTEQLHRSRLISRFDQFRGKCQDELKNSKTIEAVQQFEALTKRLYSLLHYDEYLCLAIKSLQYLDTYEHNWKAGEIKEAVMAFCKLKDLCEALQEERPGYAELIRKVTRNVAVINLKLEQELREHLITQLAKTEWPKKIINWDTAEVVKLLLAISNYSQYSKVMAGDGITNVLKILVEPIKLRFSFHFETERPTNRLDRPEWFFDHLLKLAITHSEFICDGVSEFITMPNANGKDWNTDAEDRVNKEIFAPAISSTNQKSVASFAVLDKFIDQLVLMAEIKLSAILDQLCTDAILLSHAIEAAISFHQSLESQLGYLRDTQTCAEIFFSNERIRAIWITSEKRVATQIYEDITKSYSWLDSTILSTNSTLPVAGVATNNRAADALPISPIMNHFVQLIDQLLKTIISIKANNIAMSLLEQIVFPLFEKFYQKCEFDLPPFHSTQEDTIFAIWMANAINHLLTTIKNQWAQEPRLTKLAVSAEFASQFGFESGSGPLENIFSRWQLNFEELLYNRIVSQFSLFIYESFLHDANHYARAMFYGVTIDNAQNDTTSLHESLRAALIKLPQNVSILKDNQLANEIFSLILSNSADLIASFFFKKVVLLNFFHLQGARHFAANLKIIEQSLQAVFFNVDMHQLLLKVWESATLLTLAERAMEGKPSAIAIENSLKEEDFDQVAKILEQLSIGELTFEQIEQVLSLRR